jgi:hypothetical protein
MSGGSIPTADCIHCINKAFLCQKLNNVHHINTVLNNLMDKLKHYQFTFNKLQIQRKKFCRGVPHFHVIFEVLMTVITSSPDYRTSGIRKSNLNIFLLPCHLWFRHRLYIPAVFHLHEVLPNTICDVMYVWSFYKRKSGNCTYCNCRM